MIYSYRRVSTDEQHNGPQAQADAIQRWLMRLSENIDQNNSNPIESIDFFDFGVSGSIPLSERPKGKQLVEFAQEGDTIVCSKLDRMFRSVGDAAIWIEHWNKQGVKLVAIGEGFDMTNPYGRAMAQMASVFAELEREMIRERTKAALGARKVRGEIVGGLPYGWGVDGDKLVKIESEQATISEIKKLREIGDSLSTIARRLNNAKISTKKPGGIWRATQVSRILEREKE